ncbi:MAG: pyridoxamine 5'-phosphate oxidase family protein [Steroidobacteraceae bacterium]
MGAAHPWLELSNWPKQELPREELERRIERCLTLTNLGVLATSGRDGPIASPVEFYADRLDVYIFPQPNSPKLKAMQRDPRVCFAVANPMAGWASAQGAQIFGEAELLEPDSAGWQHGMNIFRWPASAFEIGRPLDGPPRGTLMRLAPRRIVYTEHFLRRDGFAPRQIWRPS